MICALFSRNVSTFSCAECAGSLADVGEKSAAVSAMLVLGKEVEFVEFHAPVGLQLVGEKADGLAAFLDQFPRHALGEFAGELLGGIHPAEHEFDLLRCDDAGVALAPDALREGAKQRDVVCCGWAEIQGARATLSCARP